jgi:hypothetical protein
MPSIPAVAESVSDRRASGTPRSHLLGLLARILGRGVAAPAAPASSAALGERWDDTSLTQAELEVLK